MNVRMAPASRIYLSVLGLVWCGGAALLLIAWARPPTPWLALPALMLGWGAFIFYRLARLSIVSLGDSLVVRNYWTTRRIDREAIADFGIRPSPPVKLGRRVYATLRDGRSLPIDVLTRAYGPPRSNPALERTLQELREWLGPGRSGAFTLPQGQQP